MNKNPLSTILDKNIPEYTFDKYPNFAQFVKYYYEWLEDTSESGGKFLHFLENFQENNYPSSNIEPYISKLIEGLGFNYSHLLKINKPLFLSQLKNFYASRGSIESFRYLFKVLFNEDITLRYPRDYMLCPSAATQTTTHSIYTTSTNINSAGFDFIYKNAGNFGGHIYGTSSRQECSIDSITKVYSNNELILKIDISLPRFPFIPNETIKITIDDISILETVYSVLDIEIVDSGANYDLTDALSITGWLKDGDAKITTLNSGTITGIDISNSNIGYTKDQLITAVPVDNDIGFGFSARITSVDALGKILTYSIISGGRNYKKLPKLYSNNIELTDIKPVTKNIGGIKSIDFDLPFIFKNKNDIKVEVNTKNGTNFKYNVIEKTIFTKTERTTSVGVINEGAHITDSLRYQQFSYELISKLKPEQYNNIVKELLHPVGYIRFPILEISDAINLNLFNEKTDVILDVKKQVFCKPVNLNFKFTTDFYLLCKITLKNSPFTRMIFNSFHNLNDVKYNTMFTVKIDAYKNISISDTYSMRTVNNSFKHANDVTIDIV